MPRFQRESRNARGSENYDDLGVGSRTDRSWASQHICHASSCSSPEIHTRVPLLSRRAAASPRVTHRLTSSQKPPLSSTPPFPSGLCRSKKMRSEQTGSLSSPATYRSLRAERLRSVLAANAHYWSSHPGAALIRSASSLSIAPSNYSNALFSWSGTGSVR